MIVEKARAFAVEAHGAQRYGDAPYVRHLDEVVSVLAGHGFGHFPMQIAVAYLHDVLEDCEGIDRESLRVVFGMVVANAVAFCTDEVGENRKERKVKTYALRRISLERAFSDDDSNLERTSVLMGLRCKLADRVANLRACVRTHNVGLLAMYRREDDSFLGAYGFGRDPQCASMLVEYENLIGMPTLT